MAENDVQISYTYKDLEINIERNSNDDVNSIASDLEKIVRALIQVVDRLEDDQKG